MLEPVVKTIEVPCSQEQAFKVFIEEVKDTLVVAHSEQEDLQAMAFYAWLKN